MCHIAWVLRLRGNLAGALEWSRRAVELSISSRHVWWRAAAHAEWGAALLATGDVGTARKALSFGLTLAPQLGAQAYRLRCLGPLASCSDDPDVLIEADQLLASITAPAGYAWLPGVEAYLSIARTWQAMGDNDRAAAIMEPLARAASGAGWHWVSDQLGAA